MNNKSSSNKPRIISAIVIVFILVLAMALGRRVSTFSVYLCGLLICDEFLTNFLKTQRDEKKYIYSIAFYFIFLVITSFFTNTYLPELLIFFNLLICLIQFLFLFEWGGYSISLVEYLKKWNFLSILFIFLPIHSLARVIQTENWQINLIGLLLVVALVDSFAWFFGKKFGKTPLYPQVSPNKTREGAIAGLLLGLLGMYLYGFNFLNIEGTYSILVLSLLCSLAIIGDLVQSKLKRRFSIKDSSNLIPGHGGVYDRTDSILFIAPFYLVLIT